ncbi:MAG: T9SS type A sorting domain-containing protein [Chitinophagaceae bacterium]
MKNKTYRYSCAYASMLLLVLFTTSNTFSQSPQFGNGFVNLSKKKSGGTIENGDTLEIRMGIHLPWGFNGGQVVRARFYDNVPTNTVMLTGATDSLRILTNEGKTFRRYTLTNGDDAGTFLPFTPPGQFDIRINLGATPTSPGNNNPTNTSGSSTINLNAAYPFGDQPKWWSGHLFSTAFRVRVTGLVGDTITLGAGIFVYRLTNGGADQILNAVQYKIIISKDDTLCTDKIGSNFAGESNGTFGTGTTLNRPTGPTFSIPGYTYLNNVSGTQVVNDGQYAIVNNLSPLSGTNPNVRRQPNCTTAPAVAPLDSCKFRMHGGYWFISGDHSGTTTAAGNNPPAAGTNAGYMLMVNADYVATKAYQQTFTGLCPNTFYEFSAWVKNICPTCGADANLVNSWGPGVLPNLTFSLDNIDRYNTGEIDTTGWIKKGFVFKTEPGQTSIIFSIRNNSQGGGGNDWAMDDISVATCTPNLNLVPSGNSNVCIGNPVNMSCLVRSFFNNYVNFQWQVSHNGGASWTDTLAAGTGTPVLVNGNYEYTATFPSFLADSSQHLVRYRIRVATTSSNLVDPNCSFFNSVNIIVMVNNCTEVLATKIISFKGRMEDKKTVLSWDVDNEDKGVLYEIERSDDGKNYKKIGVVPYRENFSTRNTYEFTDNANTGNFNYYRIKILEKNKGYYSKIVLLSDKKEIALRSLLNPFTNFIQFELYAPAEINATITILDNFGQILFKRKQQLLAGSNSLAINDLTKLAGGSYVLQVNAGGQLITKKIIQLAGNK